MATRVLLVLSALALAQAVAEQCSSQNEAGHYHCRLRTLQDSLELPDRAAAVKKLRVLCSDLFYSESELRPRHFAHLAGLEQLDLEFCKVRHVPEQAFVGLSQLRSLSLQSHNNAWSSVLMEIHAQSLLPLPNLESLNLARNNLWSLPQGLLCNLPALREVNLSRNHLVDISDLGLSEASRFSCAIHLDTLDLSRNGLSSLHNGDLRQVASLESLDLSDNRLSILAPGSLSAVPRLRELRLSGNQLAALPVELFNRSQHLQQLELQNNSLSLLPAGVFQGLSELVVLNLSRNAIASQLLDRDTFSGLRSLRVLDLSHNRLSEVSAELLEQLPSLQILKVHHNSIHQVAAAAFSVQTSLKILSFSNNKLGQLHKDTFLGLSSLSSLSLDHNELQALPETVFDSLPQLEDLSMDNNKLKKVPKSIRKLQRLRTLDLGENQLSELSAEDLSALPELYGLRLAGNQLTLLAATHLANNTKLHVLNLARNQLTKIEQKSLDNLQELRALRLDNNRLTDINGVVSSLPKLQWFNVSSNELQWFDYAFVPRSLEWLDLHDNSVEELGNYYQLDEGFSLKTLDASHNRIRRLRKLSLPASLERLVLNHNAISSLEPGLFESSSRLERVELMSNQLESLELEALFLGDDGGSGETLKGSKPEFFLSDNPFRCDCELAWLPQINDIALGGNHPEVADLGDVHCHLANESVPVVSVAESEFLCEYKTHCFPECLCCEFYACDCRMQCPEGCSCHHDATWTSNIIECSHRGHLDVPLLIPMDSTLIRLDGNNLSAVDTQSFIGRKRVHTLMLNSSHVTTLSKETFAGLNQLEVLYLHDNAIQALHGHEFQALGNSMRELYLHNNDLTSIAANAFDTLSSLVVLRLDGNLLTTYPVWGLTASHAFLSHLYLANNLWSCECDFMQQLAQFLLGQGSRVGDSSLVECALPSLEVRPVLAEGGTRIAKCLTSEEASNDLLLQTHGEQDGDAKSNGFLVPVIASVLVLLFITLLVFLLVCVFREKIKQWLYNKSSEIYESRSGSSVASGNSCYAQNKLFDVYISYSRKDADFVDQSLAPALEQGSTSFKLCLHQRDFPPSASLYDTVSVATESSSRVVVVISRNYLDTEWNHVKIPLRNSLSKDTSRLILLLLEEPSEDDLALHPELKHYLKTCASVKWGSPGFLNKLRFFLPEPAFLTFQRNVTLRTLQPASLVKGVDQVSGVWTYTLQNSSSSPHGSVSTQSTNDQLMQLGRYNALPAVAVATSPSVISSLYSHHTYQSIPEQQQQQPQQPAANGHIYHTLEPSLVLAAAAQQQQHHHHLQRVSPEVEQINAVYINRNLDVVTKSESSSSSASPEPSSSSEDLTPCHSHTLSAHSGQQLLPAAASSAGGQQLAKDNEYIV